MQGRNKKIGGKEKRSTKMVVLNPTITIMILNLSRLNTLIKRQRLSELIIKQDSNIFCLWETQHNYKDVDN